MNIAQAKLIPIETFLTHLGYNPAYKKKCELWYQSPLRKVDKTPSFKVNLIMNTWYDFGAHQGGDMIDLPCVMFNESKGYALRRLGTMFQGVSSSNYQVSNTKIVPIKKASTLVLDRIESIISIPLLNYLKERCISLETAQKYCKQIAFHASEDQREQLAIAIENDRGAYEFRNKIFKGFIGDQKTITSINLQEGNTVSIFEGFFDFLAFLEHQKIECFQNSVIILNSIELQNDALKVLNSYKFSKAYFFLDNDEGGKKAFGAISEKLSFPFADKSKMYSEWNDYNEFYQKLVK